MRRNENSLLILQNLEFNLHLQICSHNLGCWHNMEDIYLSSEALEQSG